VSEVGESAFNGCYALTVVTLSTTVSLLGSNVFENTNIENIYISCLDGLKYGESSYIYRTLHNDPLFSSKLITQVPQNSNTYINTNFNVTNIFITSAIIPELQTAGISPIRPYPDLSRYVYPYYIDEINIFSQVTNSKAYILLVNIPEIPSETIVPDFLCDGCKLLFYVTIPNNIKRIGIKAFNECYDLTSVIIPNSVSEVGERAFNGCYGLTVVTLSTTVILLGVNVFNNTNITNGNIYIICLDGLNYGESSYIYKALDNHPLFSSKLITQVPENSNTYIDNNFNVTNIFITSAIIPELQTAGISPIRPYPDLSRYVYRYYDNNVNILYLATAPPGYSNKYILLVNIPEIPGVTTIRASLCNNCTSLFSVRISDNITIIGNYAFNGCSRLTSVIIPNNVTIIRSYAFYNCINLTTVTIPNNSIVIDSSAFNNCRNLTQIRVFVQGPSEAIIPTLTGLFFTTTPSLTTIIKSTSPTVKKAFYYYVFDQITIRYTSGTIGQNDIILYYEYRINGLDWNIVPQKNTFTYNTYNSTDTIQLRQYTQSAGYSNPSEPFQITVGIPCFKKDTRILTSDGYRRIQDIRKGDMVYTYIHGYKAVHAIGYKQIHHNATPNKIQTQLYRCSRSKYPELLEDLIITGCHSILIPEFISQEQNDKTLVVLGDIYMTDNLYRLPACVDDRTTVYETPGEYTIYHLALEHDDYYSNYGIYANGLLVETCSKRYMKELSNMTLIE
jgi:hypothetical protein